MLTVERSRSEIAFRNTLAIVAGVIMIAGLGCGNSETPGEAETQSALVQAMQANPEAVTNAVIQYQAEQQLRLVSEDIIKHLNQWDRKHIIGNSPQLGNPDAENQLIVFSDFQCPYCADVHDEATRFVAEHGDAVVLIYKHFPLIASHPEAMSAARASWAAQQQGKFWEYHDVLFTNQDKLGDEFYISAAAELGLDVDKFNTDRNSVGAAKATLVDYIWASRLGISATPTFLMNDIPLVGGGAAEGFQTRLAEML